MKTKTIRRLIWVVIWLIVLSQLRDTFRIFDNMNYASAWTFVSAICVGITPYFVLTGYFIPTISGAAVLGFTLLSITAAFIDPNTNAELRQLMFLDNYGPLIILGLALIAIGYLRRASAKPTSTTEASA